MIYSVVGLYDNLMGPLLIYICDIKFFRNAVWFNSAIARKETMPFPNVIPPIPVSAYKDIFKQKRFLLIQFYKLILLLFYLDRFINLGLYYI